MLARFFPCLPIATTGVALCHLITLVLVSLHLAYFVSFNYNLIYHLTEQGLTGLVPHLHSLCGVISNSIES